MTSTFPLRLLVVAGARPNFMKVAPILRAAAAAGHETVLVHTGQHYDPQMSDAFFTDLDIPQPAFSLGVGSGSHAEQTARVMMAFEPVLIKVAPAWVVLVGDVNSTLACALTAAKLQQQVGCRIAHVEAGLRSGDWSMPEEINRVLTDRLSDLLFLPSHDARANLEAEGIPPARVAFAGNVMVDTLLHQLPRARALALRERPEPGAPHALVTLHRPSNVDSPTVLPTLLRALHQLAGELPVVFPMHPRTRQRIEAQGLTSLLDGVRVLPPVGYTEMLALTDGARAVLTDSGGLQEETTVLGVPCVTLRQQTERPVTVSEGTNRLAPWPLTVDGILRSFRDACSVGRRPLGSCAPDGWDGHAAERIIARLADADA